MATTNEILPTPTPTRISGTSVVNGSPDRISDSNYVAHDDLCLPRQIFVAHPHLQDARAIATAIVRQPRRPPRQVDSSWIRVHPRYTSPPFSTSDLLPPLGGKWYMKQEASRFQPLWTNRYTLALEDVGPNLLATLLNFTCKKSKIVRQAMRELYSAQKLMNRRKHVTRTYKSPRLRPEPVVPEWLNPHPGSPCLWLSLANRDPFYLAKIQYKTYDLRMHRTSLLGRFIDQELRRVHHANSHERCEEVEALIRDIKRNRIPYLDSPYTLHHIDQVLRSLIQLRNCVSVVRHRIDRQHTPLLALIPRFLDQYLISTFPNYFAAPYRTAANVYEIVQHGTLEIIGLVRMTPEHMDAIRFVNPTPAQLAPLFHAPRPVQAHPQMIKTVSGMCRNLADPALISSLNSLSPLADDVRDALPAFTRTSETINTQLPEILNGASMLAGSINTAADAISSIKTFLISFIPASRKTLLDKVLDLATLLYDWIICVRSSTWPLLITLAIRTLNFCGIYATDLVPRLMEYFSIESLQNLISSVRGNEVSTPVVHARKQVGYTGNITSFFIGLIGCVVTGALLPVRAVKGATESLRNLPAFQDLATWSGDVLSGCLNMLPECVNFWFKEHFPFAKWIAEYLDSKRSLWKMTERIDELNNPESIRQMSTNYELQQEIVELDQRMRLALEGLAKEKGSNSVLSLLRDYAKKLSAFREIVFYCMHSPADRMEPFSLWLYGGAGVGKTFISDQIIRELCPQQMQHNRVYQWTSQAYKEGYTGQFCWKMEDLGLIDRPNQKADPYLDFCQAVQTAVWPLEMASAEKKDKVFFASPLVCVTSNMAYVVPNGMLEFGEPLKRRRHLLVQVTSHPDYVDERGRLDLSKFPPEPYGFTGHLQYTIMDKYDNIPHLDHRDANDNAIVYDHSAFMRILRTQFVAHTRREHDRMMYNARLDHKAMDPNVIKLKQACDALDPAKILVPIPAQKQVGVAKHTWQPNSLADSDPGLCSAISGEFLRTEAATSHSDSEIFPHLSYANPFGPPAIATRWSSAHEVEGYLSPRGGYNTGSSLTSSDWEEDDTDYEPCDDPVSTIPTGDLSKISEEYIDTVKALPLGDQIKIAAALDYLIEQRVPRVSTWRKYVLPSLAVLGLVVAGIATTAYAVKRYNQRTEPEPVEKQNGAYNSDPRHTPKIKVSSPVRAVNAKKQTDIGVTLLMTGIFRKATFTLVRQGGVAHAVAIKGTHILTCAHFFYENDVPLALGTTLELRSSTGAVYTEYYDPERLYVFSNGEGKTGMPIVDSDCAVYRCSLNTTTFRDITSHFIKEDDLQHHDRVNLSIVTTEPTGDFAIRSGIAFARTQRRVSQHPLEYAINKDTIHTLQSGWMYPSLRTLDGDCGAMLVADETTLVRKIIGIHVACHPNINRFQTGYGELVTQEMLLALLELSERDFGPSILPAENPLPVDLISEELVEAKKQAQIGELEGNFNHIGRVSRKDAVHQSTKPSHIPSPIHGMVFPVTKGPSVLSRGDPRAINLFESPIRKGCAKYGRYTLPLNLKHVDEMSRCWTDILKPLPLIGPKRVLTIDEAVTGLEYPGFESVVAKTSPGYPWTKSRPAGATGKTHLLTVRESDNRPILSSDEVRSAVEARIGAAKNNTRTPTLCVSTLKAELRSLEKIRDGKTRIFTVMPFDYTVAFRMYFLSFTAFLMQNLFAHSSCVGINPESPDWNQLADILLENSPHITAADYKDWDGVFYGSVIYEFAEIASRWYDDGEENRNIRRVLITECCKTYHLALDYVFETVQGMPSGNPATALINSIGNFIYHGCAYLRLAPPSLRSAFHFRNFVRCFTYGDDNILSIAPEIISFYNFNTISAFFAEHRIEYTLPDKSDGEQPPYAPLQFWSFLKRKFGKQYSMWVPLMDENTINSNTNFVTPSNDDHLQCNINCNEALKFAYWYGRDYFDNLRKRIEGAMIEQHVVPQLYDFAAVSALYSDPTSDYSKLAQNVIIRARKQMRTEESPYSFTVKAFTICEKCRRFKNCVLYEWKQPTGENFNPLSLVLCTCHGLNKEIARAANMRDESTQSSPSDLRCHPCDASTETDFSEVHLSRTYGALLGAAKTKVVECDDFLCNHMIVFASTHYGETYPVSGLPQTLGSLFDVQDSRSAAYRFRHRRIAETGTSRPNSGLEVWPVETQPDPFPFRIQRTTQGEAVKTVYLPVRRICLMQEQSTQTHPTHFINHVEYGVAGTEHFDGRTLQPSVKCVRSIRARKQMLAGTTENSGGTVLMDQAPPGQSLPPTGVAVASSSVADSHHADAPWTLNAMAEKLAFIKTFSWSTSQASGTSLIGTTEATRYITIPQALLTTVTNALGFTATTFWRGDVELEFRVNGSIFHVGTLCGFFVPLSTPKAIDAWQGGGSNAKQCQSVINSVLLDATDSTTATLRIPFFHQIDRLNNTDPDVTTALANYNYLGHVGLVVWNQLLASTSGSQSINVTVFARFLNNKFTVPTGAINPLSLTAPRLAERHMLMSAIEQALDIDDDAQSQLSEDIDRIDIEELRESVRDLIARRPVPAKKQMLSALAIGLAGTAGGIIAKHAAGWAIPKLTGRDRNDKKSSGYDKPANALIPPMFTQNAFDHMSYDTGLTNTHVLDIKPGQQMSINSTAAEGADELSVSFLTQKWTLSETLNWTVSQASGYQFPGTRYICPFNQGLNAATAPGAYVSTPPVTMMDWVARFGTFWSGSIKLRFRIVCTKLATGRIVIGAHYGQTTAPTSLAQITGQFAVIVDLQKDKHEFDFVLDANAVTALKRVPNGIPSTTSGLADFIYGVWSITIDNPLIVPSDLPSTAYINIFIAAGDDFKIYTPGLANSSIYSTYILGIVAQARKQTGVEGGAVEGADMSVAPQESAPAIAIAAVPGLVRDGTIAEITSLRDLIRRFVNIGTYPVKPAAISRGDEDTNAASIAYSATRANAWYIPSTPQAILNSNNYGYFPEPQHKGILSQVAMMFRGYTGGLSYNIGMDSPNNQLAARPFASFVPDCLIDEPTTNNSINGTYLPSSTGFQVAIDATTQNAFGYTMCQSSTIGTQPWAASCISPPPLAVGGPYVPQLQVQAPGLTHYNFFLCGADRPNVSGSFPGWTTRDFSGALIAGANIFQSLLSDSAPAPHLRIYVAAADDMTFFNLLGIPPLKCNAIYIDATHDTAMYPDGYTTPPPPPPFGYDEERSSSPKCRSVKPVRVHKQMNTDFHRPGYYARSRLLPVSLAGKLNVLRQHIATLNKSGDKTALSILAELKQFFADFNYEFETNRSGGLAHEPLFRSICHLNCGVLEQHASGEAHSKKAAEQNAAAGIIALLVGAPPSIVPMPEQPALATATVPSVAHPDSPISPSM